MEYIYKLNLPAVLNVLLPQAQDIVTGGEDKCFVRFYHCVDILKSQYISMCGYNFKPAFMLFKTAGTIGNLHSDNEIGVRENTWAINWIHRGNCQMQYWHKDRLGIPTVWNNSIRYPLLRWDNQTSEPDKIHDLSKDCAYLVNTAVPHLPVSFQDRYALSIRSFDNSERTWDQVVSAFSALIVE